MRYGRLVCGLVIFALLLGSALHGRFGCGVALLLILTAGSLYLFARALIVLFKHVPRLETGKALIATVLSLGALLALAAAAAFAYLLLDLIRYWYS